MKQAALPDLRAVSVTMTVPEAGAILRIGKSKAYELARNDQFPCRVIKIGSQYRVTRHDLFRFLGLAEDGTPLADGAA